MAKRADMNQSTIVAALRRVGAQVTDLHEVGHGVPDLLVWFRKRLYLLEVKVPGAKLTPDEAQWHLTHPGAAIVVRSPWEALEAIGAVEYEVRR